jgi:CubicO group peptidase (beta-lactamase class C family)
MRELRERVALPMAVDLTDGASPDLVARLAARIAPELARSVGPVEWRVGDTTGVDWTAEGIVDGALVVLCLRPSAREVSLLVDPGFARPSSRMSTRGVLAVLGILTVVSVALGVVTRSLGWAILSFLVTVAFWICGDVVGQELRVRRAVATLDRAAWRRRFQEALALALDPS